ncbi:MAG: hypothetical protein J5608_02805 [Alphaproteobacteria bacterium]|nr:hypothetical protein [Alphaproteobacteria bacterium]
MQERIEPPILISRLMAFVMATALVVLVVLLVTLDKMFPLNRPQVFFLTTQELNDKELTLTEIPDEFDGYKIQFIKEYIRYRNEIDEDLAIMQARWGNRPDGIIKSRSTDAVFGDFVLTELATIIRSDYLNEAFTITCNVDFPATHSVVQNANTPDAYTVKFTYTCRDSNSDNQEYSQPYEVLVKLESTNKTAVKWAERMENPLGFRVSQYEVLNGQPDPLDNVVFEE